MPMGTNIKMSLMPKGINKIIYNPGVSISTPENVLIPYLQYPGVLIFSSVVALLISETTIQLN